VTLLYSKMYKNTTQRILVFATNYLPNIGGAELAFHEIATRLPDITFDLIASRLPDPSNPKKLLPTEEKINNTTVYRVGSRLNLSRIFIPKALYPIMAYFKGRELSKKLGPYKKIYALQASQGGGAAWLFKFFNPRVRYILNLQEGQDFNKQGFLLNFFRGLIIKKADVVIAISNYLKNYAKDLNKRAKVIRVPNGVDIANFKRDYSYGELSGLAETLGIEPGEKIIISVSRLVPKNAIDVLIEALGILNTKYKITNMKLLIVGSGQERPSLESRAENLGLGDKVVFVGSVGHDELPKYLKIAEVFVRPSRSEGLGNAFLEAMAAGVPVIGTNVGGIPDFLENEKTGLFCKINDAEDLAGQIFKLSQEPKLKEIIIKNASNLVLENYDWDIIAKSCGDILRS